MTATQNPIQGSKFISPIYTVLDLETTARKAWRALHRDLSEIEKSVSEINSAIAGIREIVTTYTDKGAVMYGLRVLSKWEVPIEELVAQASEFNRRYNEARGYSDIDRLEIDSFYIETPDGSMEIQGVMERVVLDNSGGYSTRPVSRRSGSNI